MTMRSGALRWSLLAVSFLAAAGIAVGWTVAEHASREDFLRLVLYGVVPAGAVLSARRVPRPVLGVAAATPIALVAVWLIVIPGDGGVAITLDNWASEAEVGRVVARVRATDGVARVVRGDASGCRPSEL